MITDLAGLPFDHLGVAVVELDEASEPYELLGLEQVGTDETVEEQRVKVRIFQAGTGLVELLESTDPTGPIARFLQRRGPGVHHVAFRVISLEREIDRLTHAGAHFALAEPHPGRGGSRVTFLHPHWAGGVLIELVEHG